MVGLQGLICLRHRYKGSVPGEFVVGCNGTSGRLLVVSSATALEASSMEATATALEASSTATTSIPLVVSVVRTLSPNVGSIVSVTRSHVCLFMLLFMFPKERLALSLIVVFVIVTL